MSAARGTGSVYRRGKIWWLKYYRDGRPFRESSHSEAYAVAVRLLKQRLGQVAEGRHVSPRSDRIRVADLIQDWITEQEIQGRKSLPASQIRARHLTEFFKNWRAHQVTSADVRRYVLQRLAAGRKPGTINLELAGLKRAYAIGLKGEKIFRSPHVELLRVENARKGFFERQAFEDVRTQLREEVVRDIATVAYWTGWRKSELLRLEGRQVDVENRCLRLEPGLTKGGEGRVVYLPPEAWEVVAKWYERRRIGRIISKLLFHRRGRPVRVFHSAWTNACERAGHPGMLFHDLRRTAVRNMVRSGITESVAMRITGHRTREVFERYNIVSEQDLRDAAKKMGTIAGTAGRTGSANGEPG